jgi:hypothetical protein
MHFGETARQARAHCRDHMMEMNRRLKHLRAIAAAGT